MRQRFKMIVVTAVAMMLSYGCAFQGLRQDLEVMAQLAEISGSVVAVPDSTSPIFVVLCKDGGGKQILHAYYLAYSSGAFRFLVPPGTYYLYAFEDKNEDAAFKSDERAGWYGAPSPLALGPGEVSGGITLKVHAPTDARTEMPQLQASLFQVVRMEVWDSLVGVVVQLSDKRFSARYARKGLWEPIKFLAEPGSGIFFLEPYAAHKIPVLFVHGAGGYPQQWGPIIDSLDRSRFQPWILHYPSGLRLGLLGEFLEKYLAELQIRHRFDKLFIVAHSMGGLISRCALNHNIENRSTTFIKLLLTIATPWQGHPAATYGVEQSPVVVPSWYDMAPESPFLKKLHETALPPEVEFDLLFGYRGKANRNGELSDGKVLLSSVLNYDMQEAAVQIYGFDEDHTSILNSPAVAQRTNQLLANAAASGEVH
ncbi:MAG: alpha/beta hydrolase [Desulfosarcina sp.]|nr:alpha/beta hydrolase [Desulfobacterales bacterium]